MLFPTEPIGSIRGLAALLAAMEASSKGQLSAREMETVLEDAVRETVRDFEATGSPVITTANNENRASPPTD